MFIVIALFQYGSPSVAARTLLHSTLGQISRCEERGKAVLYSGEYSLLFDVLTQARFGSTLTGSQVLIEQ